MTKHSDISETSVRNQEVWIYRVGFICNLNILVLYTVQIQDHVEV